MQIQDECKAQFEEAEKVIGEAWVQWQRLRTGVEEAEETFLASRLPSLHKWFGVEEEDLSNWTVGGLRCTVRDRVQLLLIAPLLEKMRTRVTFDSSPPQRENDARSAVAGAEGAAEDDASAGASSSVLERMLEHHEQRLKPILAEAKTADIQLTKKIKKTEKEERAKGIVTLGMQDTRRVAALKRERPQIWESSKVALEVFAAPLKHLKAFLLDELTPEMVAGKTGAVPVVASRAICDWHFQRCLLEYETLQEWWRTTKATLQQRERLWKSLMEKEGILIRRIECGLDDVATRRHRYSVYATFGGSEMEVMNLLVPGGSGCGPGTATGSLPSKLEESVSLLSSVVSGMLKSLKAIRDSALWRVIETARSIHRELCDEDARTEVPPWQAASAALGVTSLLKELGWAQDDGAASARGQEVNAVQLVDAAVATLGRVERLGVLSADALGFLRREPAAGATEASGVLEELVQAFQGLGEDLLSLMDEPSRDAAKAWLQQWDDFFASAGAGPRLEAAMAALPLRRDPELGPQERAVRRRWLLLTRGLQVLLEDEALRAQAALPLARLADPSGRLPRPAALASSRRAVPDEGNSGSHGGVGMQDAVLALSTPRSPRVVPGLSGLPGGYPQRSSAPTPSGSSAAGALSSWRPATPSTCDDAAVQAARPQPSSKFVDGQCVYLRPDSPGMKLSPLSKSRKTNLSSTSLGLDLPPPP